MSSKLNALGLGLGLVIVLAMPITVQAQPQAASPGSFTLEIRAPARQRTLLEQHLELGRYREVPDLALHSVVDGIALQDGRLRGRLDIAVNIDLGDDFRISGQSLAAPRLTGTVLASGNYQACGERLSIERGELRFTGPPDNPALDILAVRPNLLQKAGVQVTGRAEAWVHSGLDLIYTFSYD